MTVRRPTNREIADLAVSFGFGLTDSELAEFAGLINDALRAHDWLESVQWPDAEPALVHSRDPGWIPHRSENRLGAWYRKTHITDRTCGPLFGKTVVVKDNICVADVPMACGTDALEGYIPERDATVVSRVLAAGAAVVGKAVCEPLSYSGGSHLSATGPVRNPYDSSRSSGGSSSGCAALLAVGEADLAIGGDQGGSIRGPSSWSGIYGLKPTYGVVPYTGAFGIEMTLDHLGPMARSSADVALLLDVLAGSDGLDPRQYQQFRSSNETGTPGYRAGLDRSAARLRVGVVREGFGWDGLSEPDVDSIVRAAAERFTAIGARVREVSIPLHRFGGHVTAAIACEGATALLFHGEGFGTNWRGLYVESMLRALAEGRRQHAHSLPPTLKLHALAGQWMHDTEHGVFYAKAQNAARVLARAYDEALTACDVLVMPTTPLKATLLPDEPLSLAESIRLAHEMGVNTSPFNATGHPAMSVPCGMSHGLPVGMMIVGRRSADATVLRAAHSFETEIFRPPPPPHEVTS